MLKDNTPIQEYKIKGRTVFVKREDLCTEDPMPKLAKLRGAYELLVKLKSQRVKKVGHFDTSISRAGQGIAFIARELGMEFFLCYPKKKELSDQHRIAQELGAIPIEIKPNVTPVCYAVAKREVESKGGVMIPFGVSCQESIKAVCREAAHVDNYLFTGTVVLCVGSATIISGILLHKPEAKIIGISAGANNKKQYQNIRKLLLPIIPGNVRLLPNTIPYTTADDFECPFPASPYYDLKAFRWLVEHIDQLEDPILFYNIGQL